MILVKKQILSLLVAVLVCVGFAGVLSPKTVLAADTIGFVNVQRVFASYPDISSARAAIGLEQKKAQEEFQSKAAGLDDEGKRALDKTLTERIAQREDELMGPIQKKILAAINKVAKAQGISTVFDSAAIVTGGKDITKDVIDVISK
ncbi:MAG: OmpH family outer membrane protein [Acidaminococcaceae bacterium]|jgi:Outer membrane protein|nr:OmpH family outer membrane protein [Acidaminococcaceae bacterium]